MTQTTETRRRGSDPRTTLPAHYDDLDATLAEAWRRMVRGAKDRRSAFHTMTVASVRGDGAPTARTVVLRGVDADRRVLRFHTDRRAPKLAEIGADGRVCLLLYDPGAKIQLRLDGTAAVLGTGDVPDRLWQGTRPQSRACYRQPLGPGAALDGPGLPIPVEEHDQHGRDIFTVVEVTVTCIDWLYLHIAGHRRALFDWADGAWRGRWVAP